LRRFQVRVLKLPLAPLAIVKLLRELRSSTSDRRPLVLGGARSLVDALRRELVRDGDPNAVRVSSSEDVDGAAALVYVLAGEPTEEDERVLRAADLAGVPLFVVGPEPTAEIPYALATDVLPLRPGEGLPLEELARRLAAKDEDAAVALAARLPALRRGVADALVARVARQNAVIAAAVFVPGVDFSVLTLNQLRLVLRLAAAYGEEIDAERLPEILGVVGSALGFRALARQAIGIVPIAGWAVQGAVAYAGTRALGEAAIRYFELRGGTESGAPGTDRP
jgi:uncharacterized protein (DUF697 family)